VEERSGEPCRAGFVRLGPFSSPPSPFDPPDDRQALAPDDGGASLVPSLEASIGAAGRVHFPAVPPGRYHVLVSCAHHRWADGPKVVDVGASSVDDLVWGVERGLGLVVHLVDGEGLPVPHGIVRLLWPTVPGRIRRAMSVAVDAAGQYEVTDVLYPATYTLASGGGYEGDTVDVELRDGLPRAEATLRMAGRGSVVVSVRTGDGVPVDDVTITGMPTGETSDPRLWPHRSPNEATYFSGIGLGTGRFRLGPLVPGHYAMRVSDERNPSSSQSQSLEVSDSPRPSEVTVLIDRGGRVAGRVVDGSGQPAPDVWVQCDCAGGNPRTPSEMARRRGAPPYGLGLPAVTDAEGGFVLTGLARDASCVVRASLPDGALGMVRDVRVGDEGVVVALPPAGAASKAEEAGTEVHENVAGPPDAIEVAPPSDRRWALGN
jgi:hypothetical protein